jgi:alkylation response protein AidB-like acyl-CoA dehydrogenase
MRCVAFSEPDHGSDLSSIETRGEVVGDEIVVTGHKTWVSGADLATDALVLCRTDAGLRYVVVPLDARNIEIRPVPQMSGATRLFDLILDGVRVPVTNSIPAPHLRHVEIAAEVDFEQEFWNLVNTARQYARDQDPLIRQQLAWAYSQVRIIRLWGPAHPLAKVFASEYHRRLGELALDIVGPDALLRCQAEGYVTTRWQEVFLSSRSETIAAGTSEVLRTHIAETLLQLPR